MQKTILFVLVLGCYFFTCNLANESVTRKTKSTLSPDERFGELFEAVQLAPVFPDSKTFTDCIPKFTTDKILAAYRNQHLEKDFDLKAFVHAHFEMPPVFANNFKSDTSRTPNEHINILWDVLTRNADEAKGGSLLSLPEPFIVPGGRFREIYYWDSYFTILGLQTIGEIDLIESIANNLAYLIDEFGFIPNGNRSYYLGRSQPPYFALIIEALAEEKGVEVFKKYLPALEKEYQFWMNGQEKLSDETPSYRRVVKMEDGSSLNRYWDDQPVPRPEAYKEDIALANSVERPSEKVYRDIRAACESGWDFCSRWFEDGNYLVSIRTTEIIPVDLNSLIYQLEQTLAKAYEVNNQKEKAASILAESEKRKSSILKYCWDKEQEFFGDYDIVNLKTTGILSLAGVYPLYMQIADSLQAAKVAAQIETKFLKAGGVLSTLNSTGQQWDAPNGWAPMQWMTIQGLRNYGQTVLADSIKTNWVNLAVKVYRNTGKMVEKYNVIDLNLEAGGGEYPLQDGFGWTNGVLLRLLEE